MAVDVMFGDTPATNVSVISDSELTCDVPAKERGKTTVRVVTNHGTSDTIVFEYADPAIFSIDPRWGDPAGGNSVRITGQDLETATQVEIDDTVTEYRLDGDDIVIDSMPASVEPSAVDVVVVAEVGRSNAVSYSYLPPTTITSIEPKSGPTSGGTVVITGEGMFEV